MNTNLKYIQKNMRALSPVVASIILIAVTVAVSVAVAAWMGGMTIGFMGTSSATITNVQFTDDGGGNRIIIMELKNTGTKTITIAAVKVNNQAVAASDFRPASGNTTLSMAAGDTLTMNITGTLASWVNGNTYKIDLYDGSNQVVGSTQQNAPGA